MKVVVADDHRIVREGLALILSHDDEIEIVAEAADGAELLEVIAEVEFDVILLDVRMPGMSGLDALAELQATGSASRVIVLSMYDDAAYVSRAIELGAGGYLLKNVGREELLRALHAVASGRSYIQGEVTGPLLARFMDPKAGGPLSELDVDQRRLLELVASGLDNRAVAEHLTISEATVKARLRVIYRAMGVKRRSEAVAVALRLGLIS